MKKKKNQTDTMSPQLRSIASSKTLFSIYLLYFAAFCFQEVHSFEWDQIRIESEVKPSVVSITKHTEIPFEGSSVGEFFATGFVVSKVR